MAIQQLMEYNGITTTLINGSMSLEERNASLQQFRMEKQMLISTDAGGEGLNLQCAHIVINYDLPWNPMKIEQRIGRADRIGQTDDVQVYNFILKDTIENRVRTVLEMKLAVILQELGIDKLQDVLDEGTADIYRGRTVSGILNESREKRRFYDYDRLKTYPLTEEQKKFFFLSDLGARPEISYGNVSWLFQLPADTDLQRLQSMLTQVIDNHPDLKVRYTENPDPHAEAREWYVARRDDTIAAEVSLVHVQSLDRDGLIRPYNLLGNENLYRAVLYDTEDEGKFLYLDFHHILIDEASWLVMLDDLKALMAGQTPVPEEVSGYEVALEERWRRENQRDEISTYFRSLLRDCDDSINNWINNRRDIHTLLKRFEIYDEQSGLACVTGSRVIRVSKCSVNIHHVRERCERLHITESMFFNAAFACMLGECNGQSKALYATVINNRDYAALERTVTMMCRTVPIYLKVTESELSTPQFLEQLRSVFSNANRGSVFSYEDISAMGEIHDPPRITMIYYDKPVNRDLIPGAHKVSLNTVDTIDTIMLKIFCDEDGTLCLKFDTSLDFSTQEIDWMTVRMNQLIARI